MIIDQKANVQYFEHMLVARGRARARRFRVDSENTFRINLCRTEGQRALAHENAEKRQFDSWRQRRNTHTHTPLVFMARPVLIGNFAIER